MGVDRDLEKFFDRVNHDVLMARGERRVTDLRVLWLIGSHLRAGSMLGGMTAARSQGTPQGGPLSPLRSNILLDDLDRELDRRGPAFCRYADHGNVYVWMRRSGERVLASLRQFLIQRLRLTVNTAKRAVERPWNRTFPGDRPTAHRKPCLRVAAKSVKRLRAQLRQRRKPWRKRRPSWSCQKSRGDLPQGRGRMIRVEDRRETAQNIEEARQAGARLDCACEIAGIDARTLQRWKAAGPKPHARSRRTR